MKSKLIVVVLLLALTLGVIAPLHAKETAPRLAIEVQRIAAVGQYGIVHITDQFTIHNNGTTPVSTLDFGFARTYRNNVYYVNAKDGDGVTLTVESDVNQTSTSYWMRVHFAQELGSNRTYNITVTSVLQGILNPAQQGFEYNFTAAPMLTQDASFANVTLLAPYGSSYVTIADSPYHQVTVGGFPALTRLFKPWKAYSDQTFYAPYRSVNQYFLDLDWAERDIKIGNGGTLTVTDRYHFRNPSVAVSSLTITLPNGASNVMAYDEVGALWATAQNPAAPYQVTVAPRYGLGIRAKENFTFTLTYNLPQSAYIKQLDWWGHYNLTLAFLNNREDFLFRRATVKIIAPSGLTITNLNMPSQQPLAYPIQVGQNDRSFELRGVTDQNNLTFSLAFNYVPFWSAFEALPWLLGIEIAIVAFALVVRRRRPELEIPVPVERLREFVGLYDERLALSRELVAMSEDVARGSLVKHEFRRRKKDMDLRLDELNRSLMLLKSDLRVISPHYDELIRSIDRAEGEIEASRASLNQVRGQYRAGKATRETYDSLVNDISKRIDRAEETVETVLITLREEAR